MSTVSLPYTINYFGTSGSSVWRGRSFHDAELFKHFIRDVVAPRIKDAEESFEDDIRGLATTKMATEFVERLLKTVPKPKTWEIGEALAECALQYDSEHDVRWPWNTVRDRRTPRASLPGADLVGFCCQGETVRLLFGEVKTSSDPHTPPQVMYGGSGMTWQLEEDAIRLDIHCTLLEWLHARCGSPLYRELYERAIGRYLESEGKDFLLVGVLIRDTRPNERDIKGRAEYLGKRLSAPTCVEMITWYLPILIKGWATLIREVTP
jgi:hypothetical protein